MSVSSRTIIPDGNYRMAREAMLAKASVPAQNVHPVPDRRRSRTMRGAPLRADIAGCLRCAKLDPQRPLFDITLLGIGTDGHTASLLPGDPVLEEREHWVAAVSHGRPEVRITMTYPAIDSSRRVAFLVAGAEKAEIFGAIRAGNSRVPASRVRPVGELFWFVDRAAAGAENAPDRSRDARPDEDCSSFHSRRRACQSARGRPSSAVNLSATWRDQGLAEATEAEGLTMPAPMPMKAFAASDWWKWLWRSSVGWALLFLLIAAFSKHLSLVIAAVGVVITGLADLFGRRNGRL